MAFSTKKSLLARVRKGDEISWTEFYHAYRPLILLRGEDMTLTDSEKEELVQMVMFEIYKKDILNSYDSRRPGDDLFFKYDPAKGHFRHFLRGIISNQALRILRKRNTLPEYMEELKDVLDENDSDKVWEAEWRRHVLNQALCELKRKIAPDTFQIFESYALKGNSVKKVSAFFEIPAATVYTAKCRCLETLREIVKNLEET